MKQCRCGKIIPLGIKYCDKCKQISERNKSERNKFYDENLRKNKNTYGSKRWKQLSILCSNKFNGMDIYKLYKYGIIKQGELSHHVIEINEDESKIYDIDNLIWLTDGSHKEIHKEYRKGGQAKINMQDYLFKIIERYIEDYEI
ncbi:hypothetical protein [Clostridium frigidicarnis]|nr:hypothetical protein [Clostridium frigidicarnis]